MQLLKSLLRRRLLATVASSPVVGVIASCKKSAAESPARRQPALYFSDAERNFVEAACARLIPEGDDGTGAVSAQVPFFIDRQLAGPYGQDQTRYRESPWSAGSDEQGYQLSYSPAELYRVAIKDIDAHCQKEFSKKFAELSDEQQDELLHKLEDGDVELESVPSNVFFDHLWQNTMEGFLSDPMYGGNRNFIGWKLIGFPGPRYNYVDEVSRHGERYTLPPVGLLGRDGQRIKG